MQASAAAEALHRLDRPAAHLHGENLAGVDGNAAEQYRARAALSSVASPLRAGEVKDLAQDVKEGPPMQSR